MTQLDYTDGWHPTVNPSARMPIHHLRHLQLLGHDHGILNEMPRHRGGTTIRLPRFGGARLRVIELPSTSQFAPWWLPASEDSAVAHVAKVYETALADDRPLPSERAVLGRMLDSFRQECHHGDLTVGEALWRVADALQRQLTPSVPSIRLNSLTRSEARKVLAQGLANIPGGLTTVLSRWAAREHRKMWSLVAVATSPQGVPLRVRFHADSARFDCEPLVCGPQTRATGRPIPVEASQVVEWLWEGKLIPGSRLAALAEASASLRGIEVRHFGNTYGSFTVLADLFGLVTVAQVPICPDDEDSWHYADLPHDDGHYPLHLVELATCTPQAHAAADALICRSLATRSPLTLNVKGDLDATLRSGGPGLLR